jgi:hypothetical protein
VSDSFAAKDAAKSSPCSVTPLNAYAMIASGERFALKRYELCTEQKLLAVTFLANADTIHSA